jgi:hypothetical protein
MRTLIALGLLAVVAAPAAAADPPLAEKYLHAGELAKGEQALERALAAAPKDDQARFGLGVVRFVRSVERLAQSLHEYGMKPTGGGLPILRLPVPENPAPNRISHPVFRRILDDFRRDLAAAEAPFAGVTDETVRLPLRVGLVKLDLDGDGQPTDRFLDVMTRYVGRTPDFLKGNSDLLIGFDRADASWFRGYCHLLMAMTDFMLAFDGGPLFNQFAEFCFTNPRTNPKQGDALMHLIELAKDLRVKEPDRLKRVRTHLLKVCALSVETWTFAMAEADDDHEWLPNPKQAGVLGVPVRAEMVESWLELVKEAAAVLDGKRLMPLGRLPPGEGFDLRKFLESPPEKIDLIAWLTEVPDAYRRQGELADSRVWSRAERVFGGEFLGFAAWFN